MRRPSPKEYSTKTEYCRLRDSTSIEATSRNLVLAFLAKLYRKKLGGGGGGGAGGGIEVQSVWPHERKRTRPKKSGMGIGNGEKEEEGGKPTRATDATFVMLPFQRGARCGIACLRALDKSAYSATGWSSRDTI